MPQRSFGGCSFGEHPDIPAAEARLFWSSTCDPYILSAAPGNSAGWRGIDPRLLSLPTHVLKTPEGAQVVFNRGGQRVAMDLSDISALREGVELRFSVHLGTLGPQSLALRRLHALLEGRSAAGLWTPIPRAGRVADMLAVLDARGGGASLREIAEVLFGPARVARTWNGSSDFLKSRVRRLVRDARKMSEGGYRRLLRGSS